MSARRTADDFHGARLRLARAFHGWTQADLGSQVGVKHQFVGYLEAGFKRPSAMLLDALVDLTGFTHGFFEEPLVEEFRDEECHFRRRQTTPVAMRNRLLAHGTLFGSLVGYLDEALQLPADDVPEARVQGAEAIEEAAERCRARWNLGPDAPLANVLRVIERAGVVVTALEGHADKIDAFSRAGRRKVMVLNRDKGSASRRNFDLAHELGHLVMHGGMDTDSPEIEAEADRFASAFLLPRRGFLAEFPRGPKLDWEPLVNFQRRWRVSLAAIVRRAYALRLSDAAHYQRAYKFMSAQGWLRGGEPAEPPSPEPEVVSLAFASLANDHGVTATEVARHLHWRFDILERVAGVALEGTHETPAPRAVVVQLDLFR